MKVGHRQAFFSISSIILRMKSLDKLIAVWVENSLITAEQAKAIHLFESQKPTHRWAMIGILLLGIFVLGIGLISIIAANWHSIPATLKLGFDFSFLLAMAAYSFRLKPEKFILRESLILIYIISLLASIGLISQVYHYSGDIEDALFLWGLMVLPLVLHSVKMFTPALWALLFIPACYLQLSHHIRFQNQYDLLSGFLLMSSLLGISYWLAYYRRCNQAFIDILKSSLFFSIIALFCLVDITVTFEYPSPLHLPHPFYWIVLAGSGILTFSSIFVLADHRWIQKSLFLISQIPFYFVLLALPYFTLPAISGAVLSLTSFTVLLLYFGSRRDLAMYQLTSVLLAIRFFLVYLNEIGGLIRTGLGLIVTGLIIIVLVVFWNRYQRKLLKWLGEVK